MKEFSFFHPHKPEPKDRPRFNKRTKSVYTPARTKEAEKKIREQVLEEYNQDMMEGPLGIILIYNFFGNENEFHLKKPDTDNLLKLFKDALEGICYKNDSQIILDIDLKLFSEVEGTFVHLFEIKEDIKTEILKRIGKVL